MLPLRQKFARHHIPEADITGSDWRKGALGLAIQDDIVEKLVLGTRPAAMEDKATQVKESMLRPKSVGKSRTPCPLERIPLELSQHIFGMLDGASLVCLGMMSRRLRQMVSVGSRDWDGCVRWRVNSLLERDSRAKGTPLPQQRLTCAFCKCKHDRKMFGDRENYALYGIHCLGMNNSRAEIRHCWLHMPKRFCYSPTFRDAQQEQWARSLVRDRWIATMHMACQHCGTRLVKNVQSGKEECLACTQECDVCGYIELPTLSRFGPERHLETLKFVRLIRRKKAGWVLEVEDENSRVKGAKYSLHSVVDMDLTENASGWGDKSKCPHPMVSRHHFKPLHWL